MAGSDTTTEGSSKAAAAKVQAKDEAQWPLTYALQPAKKASPLQSFSFSTDGPAVEKKPWWSYTLYRGPANKPVEILYSKTKNQSEVFAQLFVSESVIGFDMVIIVVLGLAMLLTLYLGILGVALFQRKEPKPTRQDRTDTDCNARKGRSVSHRTASREDNSRSHSTDITQDH